MNLKVYLEEEIVVVCVCVFSGVFPVREEKSWNVKNADVHVLSGCICFFSSLTAELGYLLRNILN